MDKARKTAWCKYAKQETRLQVTKQERACECEIRGAKLLSQGNIESHIVHAANRVPPRPRLRAPSRASSYASGASVAQPAASAYV